jgi:UDP-N-acetylenolpyruvoylglucosamine reductase
MLANPKTILDLVTIIGNHLRTNFQPTELKPLADIIKSFDQNSITSKVISSASDSYLISDSSSGTFYLKTKTGNFNQIQEMVKNIFSDSNTSDPILKIELLNGSKTAGLATKVSAQLPTDKFEVVSVQNSQTKYKTSTIYDYTNGLNQSTVDYLKNKYNTEVVKKSRPSGSDVDITLIIGDDFHASS